MRDWDNELLFVHDNGKIRRLGWDNHLHYKILNILFGHILKNQLTCHKKVELDDIAEIKRRLQRFLIAVNDGPDIKYLKKSLEQPSTDFIPPDYLTHYMDVFFSLHLRFNTPDTRHFLTFTLFETESILRHLRIVDCLLTRIMEKIYASTLRYRFRSTLYYIKRK